MYLLWAGQAQVKLPPQFCAFSVKIFYTAR
jgi:hypothetical protein